MRARKSPALLGAGQGLEWEPDGSGAAATAERESAEAEEGGGGWFRDVGELEASAVSADEGLVGGGGAGGCGEVAGDLSRGQFGAVEGDLVDAAVVWAAAVGGSDDEVAGGGGVVDWVPCGIIDVVDEDAIDVEFGGGAVPCGDDVAPFEEIGGTAGEVPADFGAGAVVHAEVPASGGAALEEGPAGARAGGDTVGDRGVVVIGGGRVGPEFDGERAGGGGIDARVEGDDSGDAGGAVEGCLVAAGAEGACGEGDAGGVGAIGGSAEATGVDGDGGRVQRGCGERDDERHESAEVFHGF